MKKFKLFAALAITALLGSCGSVKDIPYFQNAESIDLSQSSFLYDARIMPKDQLTITVSCINDDAAAPHEDGDMRLINRA